MIHANYVTFSCITPRIIYLPTSVPCAQKICGSYVQDEFRDRNLSLDEHRISMVHLFPQHHAERHRKETLCNKNHDLSTCGSKAVIKFPFECLCLNVVVCPRINIYVFQFNSIQFYLHSMYHIQANIP